VADVRLIDWLTDVAGERILKITAGGAQIPADLRRAMSSEHATEQVPLTEIQEGDTIQDPESGQWFTVTRTADSTKGNDEPSELDGSVVEGYRIYYGDERNGEQVDSRCIVDSRSAEALITRQVRE
jgi:hypothetical protein